MPLDGIDTPLQLLQLFHQFPEEKIDLLANPFSEDSPFMKSFRKYQLKENPAAASASPNLAPGYPDPQIQSEDGTVAGYYLDSHPDVAVLTLSTFLAFDFSEVVSKFLNASSGFDMKKKLVIDVSANGGGNIILAFDLFKQLAPNKEPYGGTRYRGTEVFDKIGGTVSRKLDAGGSPEDIALEDPLLYSFESLPFNYKYDVGADLKPFKSWTDKFGPATYNNDTFTNIIRWDLDDPMLYDLTGTSVTGHGSIPNNPLYYEPENIVIVYDGYCASTCAVFSEFMRTELGVKTVALGGRPRLGPQQAVGGVKGANVYQYSDIQNWVQQTFLVCTPSEKVRAPLARQNIAVANCRTAYSERDRTFAIHIDASLLPLALWHCTHDQHPRLAARSER